MPEPGLDKLALTRSNAHRLSHVALKNINSLMTANEENPAWMLALGQKWKRRLKLWMSALTQKADIDRQLSHGR
jgi:hypothetical protein